MNGGTVKLNSATSAGGGVYSNSTGSTTFTGVTFTQNDANGIGGGGLYIYLGTTVLTNCTISNNTAASGNGEGAGWRAGFGFLNHTGTTVINNDLEAA
jgi:hypothetical protein